MHGKRVCNSLKRSYTLNVLHIALSMFTGIRMILPISDKFAMRGEKPMIN
jgi:hypothetical protein